MARKRGIKFLECPDCNKVTPLSNAPTEDECPVCGSANSRVISSTELERRIEEGAVFDIDLSPGGRDKAKRQ